MSNSRYYYILALLALNLSHTSKGTWFVLWGIASVLMCGLALVTQIMEARND